MPGSHVVYVQWKLDLADTDLAENRDFKDTLQKIGATIFCFLVHNSARNSGITRFSGQKLTDDFSAKLSFHRIEINGFRLCRSQETFLA